MEKAASERPQWMLRNDSGLVVDAGGGGEAGGLGGGDVAGFGVGEGGAVSVDGVGVVRAEAEFLEGARVGCELGLPALVGLEFLHSGHGARVPLTGGFTGEIVFADQGLLDLSRALGSDALLSVKLLMA